MSVMRIIVCFLLFSANSYAAQSITEEEQRIPQAQAVIPDITSHYHAQLALFESQLSQSKNELKITQNIARLGQELWRTSVTDAQTSYLDDRALYWSRLQAQSAIKRKKTAFPIAQWQRQILANAFEKSSRGLSDIQFADDTQIKIILTGFDPKLSANKVNQSDTSGLAALSFDGMSFMVGNKKAQIETLILPRRFADFDQGLIEALLTPIYRENNADIVLTLGMGQDMFELAMFAGRHRSSTMPDNLNQKSGATSHSPKLPLFQGKTINGPEFLMSSLPIKPFKLVSGKWPIIDNYQVITGESGEISAHSLADLTYSTSVAGSAGGSFANEVHYRSLRLKSLFNSQIVTGHLTLPKIATDVPEQKQQLMEQLLDMIKMTATVL